MRYIPGTIVEAGVLRTKTKKSSFLATKCLHTRISKRWVVVNGQKSAAARERNAKQQGKTEEERRAASLKAAKDAQAHKCQLCLMTFMVNVKPPTLLDHVVKKHPAGTDPASCFSSLQGYDPNAPAPAPVAASTAPPKPKPKAADPFDLLAAGLKFKKGIKEINYAHAAIRSIMYRF
jgi:hypothetical protein